jgi:hypothetical protein
LKRKSSVLGRRFGGERGKANPDCPIDLWDKESSNIGTVYEIYIKDVKKKDLAGWVIPELGA